MGSWLKASSAKGVKNRHSSAALRDTACLFCQFGVSCHKPCLATMHEMCPVTHLGVHNISCLDLSWPGQN